MDDLGVPPFQETIIWTRRICHWRSWKDSISNGSSEGEHLKPGILFSHSSWSSFTATWKKQADSVEKYITTAPTAPTIGHHGPRSSIGLVSYVHSTPWCLWTFHPWVSWSAARHSSAFGPSGLDGWWWAKARQSGASFRLRKRLSRLQNQHIRQPLGSHPSFLQDLSWKSSSSPSASWRIGYC